MATLTDPAKEFSALLSKLTVKSEKSGDAFLSEFFNVPVWSYEFVEIIYFISQRIELLEGFINELDDEHIREHLLHNIREIRQAFSTRGFAQQWQATVQNFLNPANMGPILVLSPSIKGKCQYPSLTESEISELTDEVNTLETWLREHQLKEQDFIRQALLDGIAQFKARLKHVKWLGWGYTLQSLRNIIAAYMALEIGFPDRTQAPDAGAVIMKAEAFLKSVFEITKTAKDVFETGEFVLKFYGATELFINSSQAIQGLLKFVG